MPRQIVSVDRLPQCVPMTKLVLSGYDCMCKVLAWKILPGCLCSLLCMLLGIAAHCVQAAHKVSNLARRHHGACKSFQTLQLCTVFSTHIPIRKLDLAAALRTPLHSEFYESQHNPERVVRMGTQLVPQLYYFPVMSYLFSARKDRLQDQAHPSIRKLK